MKLWPLVAPTEQQRDMSDEEWLGRALLAGDDPHSRAAQSK